MKLLATPFFLVKIDIKTNNAIWRKKWIFLYIPTFLVKILWLQNEINTNIVIWRKKWNFLNVLIFFSWKIFGYFSEIKTNVKHCDLTRKKSTFRIWQFFSRKFFGFLVKSKQTLGFDGYFSRFFFSISVPFVGGSFQL